MVRPRLETREKVVERRRDIRKKTIQKLREEFLKAFREEVEELWEDFEKEVSRIVETYRLFVDIAKRRAVILFQVRHYEIPTKYMEMVIDDKVLETLPPELKDIVPSIFTEIAKARGITKAIVQRYPQLIPIIMRYIARYRAFPCKHDAFAVKLTPVTIRFFSGLTVTYYVLRWSKVDAVRSDPYLARSKPVDIYFAFIGLKKARNDIINSLLGAGKGRAKPDDYVTIYINTVRGRAVKMRLRFLMMHPHWIKYYFSKEAGREEMYNYYHHCSIYAMVKTYSKAWELRMTGDRRLIGRRPRRRIKDLLYYYGLRV